MHRGFHTARVCLSHIGKRPIPIPENIVLNVKPCSDRGAQYDRTMTITGPKDGVSLTLPLHPFIRLESSHPEGDPNKITSVGAEIPSSSIAAPLKKKRVATVEGEEKDLVLNVGISDPNNEFQKAMWGTTRSLIANMVTGVTEMFKVHINFVGVGYRASIETAPQPDPITGEKAKAISLKVGYSHPILIPIPKDINVSNPNPTTLVLTCPDNQKVKSFAMIIRKWRKPEPYNLKGIFVDGETIKKKEGKKK
jgi:large subunit ribosomal protein L6